MKAVKSAWKVCLVVVGSFTLGAWLFHVRTVRANPQAWRTVRITSVFMGAYASGASDHAVDGGPVVGFSCVANVTGPSGKNDRVCFIATQSAGN
jgi:hypothetical protein